MHDMKHQRRRNDIEARTQGRQSQPGHLEGFMHAQAEASQSKSFSFLGRVWWSALGRLASVAILVTAIVAEGIFVYRCVELCHRVRRVG
jgi:hypothetical protein